MMKIDTSQWKEFKLKDIFHMNNTKSIVQKDVVPDSGTTPYVTAQAGNNGVMTYINCPAEWLDEGNCIMIGGKTLTFSYQAKNFCSNDSHNIALYLKDKKNASEMKYLFLIAALRGALYQKYSWGDSISMKKIQDDVFRLPVDTSGDPDWAYMDNYMSEVVKDCEDTLIKLNKKSEKKHTVDTSQWKEFYVGNLFSNFIKPPVLHARQVVKNDEGIPYVVRTKFDNGIKCRVQPVAGVIPSPAGVITWGAENATFFYQTEPFLSGRDIYYIDTREYSQLTCMFLASCLQTITHKYPYNFGLFPDLLKEERIKLPVDASGNPDWAYMDEYMQSMMEESKRDLSTLQSIM
jgi:hypothetical protein